MSATRRMRLAIKCATDCFLAGAVLLALSPLMVAIAMLIKVSSRGPALFRQERLGLHGRTFQILKFRSMVPGAVERAGGHVTRLDSPLVTPLGRLLRVSSLDELPQLLNVLRGEMSLVGPRPLLAGSVHPSEKRRNDMRPGCTSLAVASGRQALDWDRRLELDLWYIDHWSLTLDLKIIAKTIPAMLLARNVYSPSGEMQPRPGAGKANS